MKSNVVRKNTHFTYSDRVKLQYNLDNNFNLSASSLARVLHKSRSAVYYESDTNTSILNPKDKFNSKVSLICPKRLRFPFTCNVCANTRCSHKDRIYIDDEAHFKARKLLVTSKSKTIVYLLGYSAIDAIRQHIKIANITSYGMEVGNNASLTDLLYERYIKNNV